jgi:hypothetical protein
LHPSLAWSQGMSVPCYLVGRNHIILPAFSRDAAGCNVLRSCRWQGYRCLAIAVDRVLDFGSALSLRRNWQRTRAHARPGHGWRLPRPRV